MLLTSRKSNESLFVFDFCVVRVHSFSKSNKNPVLLSIYNAHRFTHFNDEDLSITVLIYILREKQKERKCVREREMLKYFRDLDHINVNAIKC